MLHAWNILSTRHDCGQLSANYRRANVMIAHSYLNERTISTLSTLIILSSQDRYTIYLGIQLRVLRLYWMNSKYTFGDVRHGKIVKWGSGRHLCCSSTSASLISFTIDCFYGLWSRRYENWLPRGRRSSAVHVLIRHHPRNLSSLSQLWFMKVLPCFGLY